MVSRDHCHDRVDTHSGFAVLKQIEFALIRGRTLPVYTAPEGIVGGRDRYGKADGSGYPDKEENL